MVSNYLSIYIGIDPGWSGAIAIGTNISKDINIIKCPIDIEGMKNLLQSEVYNLFKSSYFISVFAVLEKLHGRGYKEGKGERWSAHSTFRFGTNYGAWLALLSTNNITYKAVDPQAWQKVMLGKFATGKSKIASLDSVYRKHPDLVKKVGKNHNYADAVNLLDFCKLYFGNKKK